MEQKRTLWIIAAVGVFLLVVLGAALILYSPATQSSQSITRHTDKKPSSNGWISLAPSSPLLTQNKENPNISSDVQKDEIPETNNFITPSEIKDKISTVKEVTIYADNATIYNSDNNKTQEISDNSIKNQMPQTIINNTTTIDLNTIQEPKPVVSNVTPKTEPAKKAVKNVSKNTEKYNQKTQSVVAPTSVAKKQITKSEKTNIEPTKKTIEKTQFWIQVTSLTSRKNADLAREVLTENKISADVFTYTDAKGKLFYRVRVGPYTTKSEAEYWQSKISKIDSFKDSSSYVASTKVKM